MNRASHYALKVAPIPAFVALIGFCIAGVSYAQHQHMMPGSAMPQTGETKPAKENTSLQTIYAQRLPALQETVKRAIQHLEAGHHQEALNEMRQIQSALVALHQALGQQVGPRFLNDRCPIRGARIDLDKVPAALTRVYGQGQVAFCCAGCPDQWDRLTDAQKVAQLKQVARQPQSTHQGTQHQP
jgi:hypothetical protein